MTSKLYKGPQIAPRYDGSESISSWPRTIAQTQTYPALRRRNALALLADPIHLHFYQRLTSGRRCTCWGKNTSPNGDCSTCFGTGLSGGYQKWGTYQLMIDPSLSEGVTSEGIGLLTTGETGSEAWVLEETEKEGYIEITTSFEGCSGAVETLYQVQWEPPESSIVWTFKKKTSGSWMELTKARLEAVLVQPQILVFRANFKRLGLESDSPVLVNALIRIGRRLNSQTSVTANRPKVQKSLSLSELGQLDEWASQNFWFDHTLARISSDDWFYDIADASRWKVVEATALSPEGYLLSWDVTCRKINGFESYMKYPF